MHTNPLGLRQVEGFNPPKEVMVHGVKWTLRRDYRDPLTKLPPPKDVKWDDSGYIPLPQYGGKVYWFCMYGTKFPTLGSQEVPTRVLYQWFHTIQLTLNPNFITDVDWSRANVYVSDYGKFAEDFCTSMLDVTKEVAVQAGNVQEWEETIDTDALV